LSLRHTCIHRFCDTALEGLTGGLATELEPRRKFLGRQSSLFESVSTALILYSTRDPGGFILGPSFGVEVGGSK
jgi:hypothetical protein